MSGKVLLHLRAEVKPQEERVAITPENAKKLLDTGLFQIHVERCTQRIFPDALYQRTIPPPPQKNKTKHTIFIFIS